MPPMPDLPRWPVTTFDSLSDDCILLIIQEVKKFQNPTRWSGDKPAIQKLSLANKRLRALCLPYIFNLRMFTVQRREDEEGWLQHLKAMRQSTFVGPTIQALLFNLRITRMDDAEDKIISVPSSEQLGAEFVETLQTFERIRELDIRHLKTMDRKTKASLRKATFNLVEVLDVRDVQEAALLIKACPSLATFKSTFPCAKFKTTFQAFVDSSATQLELNNEKGWRVKNFRDLRGFLGTVTHLCFKGEIKDKVTALMPEFQGLQNILTFAITIDPWVNYPYFRKYYFNDRFLDAVDDAKEDSPLNEDQDMMFRAIFDNIPTADTAWIIPRLEEETVQSGVVRKSDGTVDNLVPQPLRPSGDAFVYRYSPFSSVTPKHSLPYYYH